MSTTIKTSILVIYILLSYVNSSAQTMPRAATDSIFAFLQKSSLDIVNDISVLKKQDLDLKRSNISKVPQLKGIDLVKIGMKYDSIISILGNPQIVEEIANLMVLTYIINKKTWKISISLINKTVVVLMTNSSNVKIPYNLSIGMPISKFENVYGSREYRKTKRISIDYDLLIYPLSNLSLVVNSKSRIVEIFMITIN